MTVTIFLITAAAFAGAALGLVLGGILSCGKAEDSYRAGYERGLAEGNPFDVRVNVERSASVLPPVDTALSGMEFERRPRSHGGSK